MPWFVAAAVLSVAAGAASFVKPMLDSSSVSAAKSSSAFSEIARATRQGNQLKNEWQNRSGQATVGASASNVEALASRRSIYPMLMRDINALLASAAPQPELFDPTTRLSIPAGDWRFFELVSLDAPYITPSGSTPKWTGTLPGATQGAQPEAQDTAQETRDGGGRRGGGGGMGISSGGGRDAALSSRRSRNRQQEEDLSASAVESSAQFGRFDVVLTVNASHSGLQAFVDETILEWLRVHQDDASKPYTFSVPEVSQIVVTPIQSATNNANTQTTSSTTGQRNSGGARNRGGSNTPGPSGGVSGPLGQIAPIDGYNAGFPSDADVYQYTLSFTVTLRDPASIQKLSEASVQEARR